MIIRLGKKRAMKQSIVDDDSNWITETEREVAEILLDLPRLIAEPVKWEPLRWKNKRKRRFAVNPRRFSAPPSTHGGDDGGSGSKKDGGEASSPDSPMLFPATDSDEKINSVHKKVPMKRKRELCIKTIEDETETKAALETEIDKVTSYWAKLSTYNSKLKLRKNQLRNGYKIEGKSPNLELKESTQLVHVNASFNPFNSQMQMCGPSQIQHASLVSTTSFQVPSSSTTIALHNANSSNKLAPFDLNASPEKELPLVNSCQPLDQSVENRDLTRGTHVDSCQSLDQDRVVAAAQARLRRIQIHRRKKEESSIKK